ncbi:cohesin domain-containing protein [Paenibacillus sp. LHD-38]|uniref:cohesin domain-containing protein n=1 Tax=Paenibacillus sp. LHD-38 TaxID=3072143 RepID=UPI00280EB4D4|nr:cohesin domain-containing protein [Paenibacillus sp. LHD-38]MDQ8737714.1 cohesin domain-containing protein [Paenibacillus sp. LHD-38]
MTRWLPAHLLSFKLMLAVAISLFMTANIVSASEQQEEVIVQTVNADEASGFVTVQGKIASGSGKQVTLTFTDPSGKLDYLNQTTSGADGFFAFTYLPSAVSSGDYLLRAGGEEVNTPYQRTIQLNGTLAGAVLKGPDTVQAGQNVELVFGLKGVEEDVMAQDMTLVFDETKLEFISVQSMDEVNFIIADYKQTEGKIRFLSVHLNEAPASRNIDHMKLTFKAKENAADGIANVAITELITADSSGVETMLQGASHGIQIGHVDKAALNALLADAQQTHHAAIEGNRIGQYPAGSKDALQKAIDKAVLIASDASATQIAVTKAAEDLNAALEAFKAAVITKVIGDNNNDDRVSIGDLAVMAKAYGMTSQKPGWDAVKGSDLNHDGKIDIEDLAALARLIFNW